MWTTSSSVTPSPVAPQKKAAGIPYLAFQLEPQTPALLPMTAAQAVLVVPASRLTPMPNMPAPILGLINRRSRVLWLVDLAHLLGLTPLSPDARQYDAITVQLGQSLLVLAVHSVKGVVRIVADQVQPLQGTVNATIAPYLQGCVVQHPQITLVLDVEAVMRSSLLAA